MVRTIRMIRLDDLADRNRQVGKRRLEELYAEAEDHVRKAIESLRLRQEMDISGHSSRTTPKQLAEILGH